MKLIYKVALRLSLAMIPLLALWTTVFYFKMVDEINKRNGADAVRIAVQGYGNGWHIKNEYISKQYTTNIKDIIIVKA